jgi:TolB-like protein
MPHAELIRPTRLALASTVAGLALGSAALAQSPEPAARLVQALGDVRLDAGPASAGMAVGAATTVHTGANSQAQLRLADGTLLALPPGSSLRLPADSTRTLTLLAGGLRLQPTSDAAVWRIDLADRSIRTNGFLKLQPCGTGCPLPAGLYGRVVQGDAVLEYQGGRAVMRGRSFHWPAANTRPEVLATQPALLDDTTSQNNAIRVRTEVAELLKIGMEAFRDGNDTLAVQSLEAVRRLAPGETVVPYYLGLVALKRQDNDSALRHLQQYTLEDPEGAAERDVPKTLTLLASSQLQQEVASAVARESEVVGTPPEPGSIAVQAFVNQGNPAYRAMAKGLAAMIIADLSKVPGLKVLEREKVQLLVNEAKLGDSGLADTASAVRSGRLMRAEKVVVGNFEVQ